MSPTRGVKRLLGVWTLWPAPLQYRHDNADEKDRDNDWDQLANSTWVVVA